MTEEYLDMAGLLKRVPFSKRVIESFISTGALVEGVHFRRPGGPGTKRIFFWTAIEKWLKGQDFDLKAGHARKNQERHPLSRFPVS